MALLFINYRALDQAGYATLIDRELVERFGAREVFRDSRSIQPGRDFADAILHGVRRCRVLLVVIGPEWLRLGALVGRKRETVDWVRLEIVEAFAASVCVLPVLVQDARMPAETELPAEIAALARCQYVRLHHRTIDDDIRRLVEVLRRLVPELARDGRRGPIEHSSTYHYLLRGISESTRRIGVLTGSIRGGRDIDAWVNSENTDMEMARFSEFAVSAIIRYHGARHDGDGRVIEDLVGDELSTRVERAPVAPCAAFITRSGSLARTHRVRYIVHVAAVQGEPGAGFRQVNSIGRCVSNALACADRQSASCKPIRSILFPLLGTGVAGGPLEPTVRTMVKAAVDYLSGTPESCLEVAYFLAYSHADLEALTEFISTMTQLAPTDR